MRNIKIVVEYVGTGYFGWQRQNDPRTIQEVLEETIYTITKEHVRVIGSGRTDAGVHAMNQVANFKTGTRIDENGLLKGMNSLLPDDIVVKELEEVGGTFHAQFDARSKVYLYRIFNRPVRSALYRQYAWHIRDSLDTGAMSEAAAFFKRTCDFSSFCAANCGIRNHVRSITCLDIEEDDRGMINISIEADGFLKHMVRNIVGTLVSVGKGKIGLSEINGIIESRDRRRAGMTAPAHGLFLKEVKY